MKTSNEVKSIFKAQIGLQSELGNIAKDSKGYGYNYTSLERLISYVKPFLAKYELGFIQTNTTLSDGSIGVTTRLIHSSGEWVEDTLSAQLYKLAKMNEYQVTGSIITYFRRYGLASILGIASDDDMDAQGEVQQPQQEVRKAPPPSKATADDKKQVWSEFTTICTNQGVDAVEFLSQDIDMTDKTAVYAETRKWLSNEQLLKDQLLSYKNG